MNFAKHKKAWLAAGAVLAAAAAYFGTWYVVRPSGAEGERWSNGFIAFVTSPGLLNSTAAAALATVPGADPITHYTDGCVGLWQFAPHWPQTVSLQKYEVHHDDGAPCDAAPFKGLETWIRPSSGVTSEGFIRRLTDLYGEPAKREQTERWHRVWYTWRPTPRLTIDVMQPLDGHDNGDMLVQVRRDRRSTSEVPTHRQNEAWLIRFVDMLAGLDSAPARRDYLVTLFGNPAAESHENGPCPRYYNGRGQDGVAGLPLIDYESLNLQPSGDGSCRDARFNSLHVSIWRAGGVTPDTFMALLTAKFGPPQSSTSAEHDQRFVWQNEASMRFTLKCREKRDDILFEVDVEAR